MDGDPAHRRAELFRARIPGPRAFLRPPRAARAGHPQAGGAGGCSRWWTAAARWLERGRARPPLRVRRHQDPLPPGRGRVRRGPGASRPWPRPGRPGSAPSPAGMNELFRAVTAVIPDARRPAFRDDVRAFLVDATHPLGAGLGPHRPVRADGALDEDVLLGNVAAMKGGTLGRLEPSRRSRAAALRRPARAAVLPPLPGRRAALRRGRRGPGRRRAAPAGGAGGAAPRMTTLPLVTADLPGLGRGAPRLARGLPRGRGAGLPAPGRAARTST